MKIAIPADCFYKGAPAQTLEIDSDALRKLNPATAWDEYIAREAERIRRLDAGEGKKA